MGIDLWLITQLDALYISDKLCPVSHSSHLLCSRAGYSHLSTVTNSTPLNPLSSLLFYKNNELLCNCYKAIKLELTVLFTLEEERHRVELSVTQPYLQSMERYGTPWPFVHVAERIGRTCATVDHQLLETEKDRFFDQNNTFCFQLFKIYKQVCTVFTSIQKLWPCHFRQ